MRSMLSSKVNIYKKKKHMRARIDCWNIECTIIFIEASMGENKMRPIYSKSFV